MHKLSQKMVIVISNLKNSFNGHIGTRTASDDQKNYKGVRLYIYMCMSSELIGKT